MQVNQSTGNSVNGNLLGTDAAGSVVLGDDIGVELDGGATGNTIGSAGPGANAIAGSNDVGVLVSGASGDTIAGNFIGTDRSGTPLTTIRNDEGVRILNPGATGNAFSSNRISSSANQGIEAAEGPNTISGNTIDHNGGPGITVAPSTTGVTISGNSIDLNTGLGIDIGNAGITPTGPSSQQSFPTGLAATVFSSTVRVTGTLASAPNTTYTVEFFVSPAPDPSGNGEGAAFLGLVDVVMDGTGAGAIDALLVPSSMPAVGQWLSATTTAPDGSTSEFATSVQLQAGTATTVSIAPEADTFVDANQPGENFGTLDYSDVYGGSNPAGCVLADGMSYTLMRFDLSSLPAGATIVDAQLQTTTRAGYAQDGDPDHWALFLPDDSWDPTTVTWNNRPSDGTASPGSRTPTGGGDIRQSDLALGAADVFRASCGADNAGDQAKIFPSTSDGGLQSVAQGITHLAGHITSQRSGDGKLSLELWTPSCLTNPNLCDPGHDNFAYWARYYTTRASDPKLRPSLRVTYSAPVAPTGSITLSTGGVTNVLAGAPQVQLANFPLSALVSGAFGVHSSPVGSIPVGSIPVGSIPVGSIPVGSIPVSSIGLTATQTLLSSIALSTIPLSPPSSWAGVLAGTPLAGLPLQNVTLAQVLAIATPAGRAQLRPGRLDQPQPQPARLAPPGGDRARFDAGRLDPGAARDRRASRRHHAAALVQVAERAPRSTARSRRASATTTMVSLALQGAPVGSIPVGSIPVGSIPYPISIPVGSIKLGNIPVGSITVPRVNIQYSPVGSIPVGSIPVNSIPVGSIPVGSIPVSSIDLHQLARRLDPGQLDPRRLDPHRLQLHDRVSDDRHAALQPRRAPAEPDARAAAAGDSRRVRQHHLRRRDRLHAPSVLNGYTVAQLINSLPPNSGITYADVLALLLNPGELSWETLDLTGTPIQNFSTGGSTLDYTADFHLAPNGGPVGVPARGDARREGPRRLRLPDGEHAAAGQRSSPRRTSPATRLRSRRDAPLDRERERRHQLQPHFTTRPEPDARPDCATATITPAGGVARAAPAPAPVTVGDTLEPNDTPAAGPADDDANGSGDSFYLSYLTAQVRRRLLQVPRSAGRLPRDVPPEPSARRLRPRRLRPGRQRHSPGRRRPRRRRSTASRLPTPASRRRTRPIRSRRRRSTTSRSHRVCRSTASRRCAERRMTRSAVISNGEAGNYTVQVSGFNGATSNDPYMLRVETTPPPAPPACTPRTLRHRDRRDDPRHDRDRPGRARREHALRRRRPAAQPDLLDRRHRRERGHQAQLAGDADRLRERRLPGRRRSRRRQFERDARPSRPGTAARPIPSRPTGSARRSPTCSTPCGRRTRTSSTSCSSAATTALPFWRLDDLTTLSTENGYAETFPLTSALGGSLVAAKMLSDDPYGTTEPVPFFNQQLDVPDLVTGRLVETPTNINAQLDAFIGGTTPGHLHPATALTTGYDFLSDGATAVSQALGAAATGTANKTAINDTWTKSTLIGPVRCSSRRTARRGARHRLAERARRSQPLQARSRHRSVQRV